MVLNHLLALSLWLFCTYVITYPAEAKFCISCGIRVQTFQRPGTVWGSGFQTVTREQISICHSKSMGNFRKVRCPPHTPPPPPSTPGVVAVKGVRKGSETQTFCSLRYCTFVFVIFAVLLGHYKLLSPSLDGSGRLGERRRSLIKLDQGRLAPLVVPFFFVFFYPLSTQTYDALFYNVFAFNGPWWWGTGWCADFFFFFSNKQSTLISPAFILSCTASRRNKCESL